MFGIQTGDRLCHFQKSSIPRPVLNQFSSDFVLTLHKYCPLYVDHDGFCLESPIRSGNMSICVIFAFGDFWFVVRSHFEFKSRDSEIDFLKTNEMGPRFLSYEQTGKTPVSFTLFKAAMYLRKKNSSKFGLWL